MDNIGRGMNKILRRIDSMTNILEGLDTRIQRMETELLKIRLNQDEDSSEFSYSDEEGCEGDFNLVTPEEEDSSCKLDPPPFMENYNLGQFRRWIEHVERCFEFSRTPDDEEVEFVVSCSFKDGVLSWWEQIQKLSMRIDKKPIQDWTTMKKLLMARFFCPDSLVTKVDH
ncbi:unnamed protein product [Lactuca saligna]|uniref:Retrotransposon gag domain-containing protein n=1 Tax=Lactuca saligna TaxID=75948 RepID=A0AA35Z5U2_LACSI|nr:unnamed protein product [Lactuca saligna]